MARGYGIGTARDGLWANAAVVPRAALVDVPEGVDLKTAAAQLMEEAVRRHQLNLPLVAAIAQRLAEGAKENPDKDMSASYLTSTPATHPGTGPAR